MPDGINIPTLLIDELDNEELAELHDLFVAKCWGGYDARPDVQDSASTVCRWLRERINSREDDNS